MNNTLSHLVTRLALVAFSFVVLLTPALLRAQTSGPAVLDGNLNEWGEFDRLDLHPWRGTNGTALYNGFNAPSDLYTFALRSNELVPGTAVSIAINADRNDATGAAPYGIEYQIVAVVGAPSSANLYIQGNPQPIASLPVATGAGALELALPRSLINGSPSALGLLFQIGNNTFLPTNFSAFQYTAKAAARPLRTSLAKRVGIVYSPTTAARYFDPKAYSQLFMAAQHQAMMAGIPFTLLSEEQLIDIKAIVNFDALVFPLFSHVSSSRRAAIEDTLSEASYRYGIGFLAAGNFMTNDESGAAFTTAPYRTLIQLFGVSITASGAADTIRLAPATLSHPIMKRYATGDLLRQYLRSPYTAPSYLVFEPIPGTSATRLVTQTIDTAPGSHSAVIASQTGGRNVHFATDTYFGDTDLGWAALRWIVFGSSNTAALQMGRQKSLFFGRNDADQTQYHAEFNTVLTPLAVLIDRWKTLYNFVGSYFITIGNNPAAGEFTDWSRNRPYYLALIGKGNEIGNHSYSHPEDTNFLSDAELRFQFGDAKTVIQNQLGVPVFGAAIPGNPDTLSTALKVENVASHGYLTGGFSGIDMSLGLTLGASFQANEGAGFHGAFGYLTPQSRMMYLSPNMTPDFTMYMFRNLTPLQAETIWRDEYRALVKFASQPIIAWQWHDYGPTTSVGDPADPSTVEMFENTIKLAYDDNAEFVTGADILGRTTAFLGSQVTVNPQNSLDFEVNGSNLGTFSLAVDQSAGTQNVIQRVSNWYAYNNSRVFLPENGGRFTIALGTQADDLTRITALPMRARLISLSGDGTTLAFTFIGEGKVEVTVRGSMMGLASFSGADAVSQSGTVYTLTFNQNGSHTVSLVAATPTATATRTATPAPTQSPTPTPGPVLCQNPLGTAFQYNLFSSEYAQFNNTSAIGRVAAKTVNFTAFAINSGNSAAPYALVCRSGTAGNGRIHGNVDCQLTNSGLLGVTGVTRFVQSVNFDNLGQCLGDCAARYCGLPANGSATLQWGGLRLSGSNSGLNVFRVSTAQLAATREITLSVPSNATVLVNVIGTTAQLTSAGFSYDQGYAGRTLYNFCNATSLTINGVGVKGSVLAPLAVTSFNNGIIHGSLATKRVQGTGAYDNVRFIGEGLPSCTTSLQVRAKKPKHASKKGNKKKPDQKKHGKKKPGK